MEQALDEKIGIINMDVIPEIAKRIGINPGRVTEVKKREKGVIGFIHYV